ncbi:MAG: hypothetical protein ABJC12_11185, partial [Saprospiraceae bacterium]
MKFGLIGYPLTHSFSKKYFTEKFINLGLTNPNFSYENYPLENVEDLIPLLRSDLFGLNVTIPYKSLVIPFLDEIDPVALQIGAVNTLVKTSTNTWKGFNTDVTAFRLSLENWMTGTPLPKQALILGTGGASKAISHALFSIGIKPSTVSRSGKSNYVYEDLNGNLWHYKNGKKTALTNFSATFWEVKDDIVVWGENNMLYTFSNGEKTQVCTYTPKDYQLKNNVFAFRNLMGG